MDRLTYHYIKNTGVTGAEIVMRERESEVLDRLAAYEDTDMAPDEIVAMKEELDAANMALDCIRHAPTVDAEHVRYARWIYHDSARTDPYYTCSNCGSEYWQKEGNYCKWCGAEIDYKAN